MTWQGAPDEDPAPLFGSDGAFNYGGYRSSALDALLDEARAAAGPGARAPILDAHRAPAGRRAAGDLSLSLRRPRAGRRARARAGRGRRSLRLPPRVARMIGAAGRARGAGRCAPAAPAAPGAARRLPARDAAAGLGVVDPFRPPESEGDRAQQRRRRSLLSRRANGRRRASSTAPPRPPIRRSWRRGLNVACSFVRQERFAEATAEVRGAARPAPTSPGRARCWRRPIWARSRRSPEMARHPARDGGGRGGLGRGPGRRRAVRRPRARAAPDPGRRPGTFFVLNPHQEVYRVPARDGTVSPADHRGRACRWRCCARADRRRSSTSPPRS